MRYRIFILLMAAAMAAGCPKAQPPADAEGDAVPAGQKPPQRILSLAPNITEILFELGLQKKIVARSTFCDYPPEAKAIPSVGDTLSLDQEKILALHPNLAFVVTQREDLPRTLEGMGIHTVVIQCDRLPQLYEAISTIGRETGRETLAKKLRHQIGLDMMTAGEHVKDRPRPRTLFAFPMTLGSAQMMVAGRGSFVDDLLAVAGAENAYPDVADWPAMTPEQAIALAPEVVIINAAGDDAAPDRIEAVRRSWARWTSIPAVANGRVYILTESYLTIPGPRIGKAAIRLSQVIHPEAWPADDSPKSGATGGLPASANVKDVRPGPSGRLPAATETHSSLRQAVAPTTAVVFNPQSSVGAAP
jgi:iron complex transport system substrate-binding protein